MSKVKFEKGKCTFTKTFSIVEIELHGKKKYEIVYTEGGKHVAYLNDQGEATNVLRHMNSSPFSSPFGD